MTTRARNSGRKQRRSPESLPTSARDLFERSSEFQDTYDHALYLVGLMREGATFGEALRRTGLSRPTALRLTKGALLRQSNGRYVARRRDQLLRVLIVPSADGLTEVAVRDSREASRVGQYWAALHRYLALGDASALRAFRGAFVADVNGDRVPLPTDRAVLDELGSAGVLSFESIYARVVR